MTHTTNHNHTVQMQLKITLLILFFMEQLVLLALSLLMIVLLILQINSERFDDSEISRRSIKYQFHRLGLVSALILTVIALDPFSLHGILSDSVVGMLICNHTAIMLTCLLLLNHVTVAVWHRSHTLRTTMPTILKVTTPVLITLSFLIGNASYGLAYINNRLWFTSFFLLWIAVVVFFTTVIFVASTVMVLRYLREEDPREHISVARSKRSLSDEAMRYQRESAKRRSLMKWRAYMVLLFMFVVVPYELLVAWLRFREKQETMKPANLETWNWSDRLFLYFSWIAQLLVLWYSW